MSFRNHVPDKLLVAVSMDVPRNGATCLGNIFLFWTWFGRNYEPRSTELSLSGNNCLFGRYIRPRRVCVSAEAFHYVMKLQIPTRCRSLGTDGLLAGIPGSHYSLYTGPSCCINTGSWRWLFQFPFRNSLL